MASAAVVDDPIDAVSFWAYVEQVLVPTLQPDDVVGLDNLAAHQSGRSAPPSKRSARESAFCRLTVDFDPTEQTFAKPKAFLRPARP
jgi:hypothetical protein